MVALHASLSLYDIQPAGALCFLASTPWHLLLLLLHLHLHLLVLLAFLGKQAIGTFLQILTMFKPCCWEQEAGYNMGPGWNGSALDCEAVITALAAQDQQRAVFRGAPGRIYKYKQAACEAR